MDTLIATYVAWAGPNAIAALAASSLTWWLLGWRRTGSARPSNLSTLILAMGAAVVTILAISILAVLLGISPVLPSGSVGVIAGIVAALVIREGA